MGLHARFLPSHRLLCNGWLSPRQLSLLRNGLMRTAPVEWFSLSLAPGSAAAANPGYLLSDAQYDPAGRNLPAVFSICYDTRGFAILQAEFRP